MESHRYLKKAVKLRNNFSAYHNKLGLQYYQGVGCPKNTILALTHFSLAKTLDPEIAPKKNYQFVYEEATNEQRAKAEEKSEIWEKIED